MRTQDPQDPQDTAGTVVVGVDGSPGSDRALSWAAQQAALEGRVLSVAHATNLAPQVWAGHPVLGLDEVRHRVEASAQRLLHDAAARAVAEQPGLEVRCLRPADADPRVVLLETAQEASLLVVGSHGRGPVRSLLLGSVGVAVSRLARCPVVVVRPQPHGPESHGVVVGVDLPARHSPDLPTGQPTLHPAVAVAFALASARALPLTVLQCVPADDGESSSSPTNRAAGIPGNSPADRRARLTAAVADLGAAHPEVEVTLLIEDGFLDRRLIKLSEGAQVVVVGSVPITRLQQVVYGSLAPTVVEHSRGVVVVVPAAGPSAAEA